MTTLKGLIKSILLTPGRIVSLSLHLQKGTFRGKEVNGVKGKALVKMVLDTIQQEHVATVEKYTTANKSQVSYWWLSS